MRSILGKSRRSLVLFLAACAVVICAAGSASAGQIDRELRSALQSRDPSDHVSVIIHLTDKANLAQLRDRDKRVRRSNIIKSLRAKADVSQKAINALLKRRTAKGIRQLWITNGIAATVRAEVVSELAALPGVERITADEVVRIPVPASSTAAAPEWNISAVKAPDLWSLGYTGQGIVLASMDSGVDLDHPDLQSRWRGGANSWFDPNDEHASPADVHGHGTQTVGIMVGGDAGGTSIGIAPGAQWIAVKIFNDDGDATYSAIHQGFQWLLDPDGNPETDDMPDVVNNSWGLQDPNHECNTEFQADVQALQAAGIALSFAAGNDGPAPSTGQSPANYAESFSVGAVDNTNTIADFSSRGPSACDGGIFPFVVAPGVNIRTTDLYMGIPNAYVTVSGTSFAAPHVAGAMALLLSAFPGQTVSMVETAILNTVSDLGPRGPDNDYGYGLIDILKAFRFLNTDHIGIYNDGMWYLDLNGSGAWDGPANDGIYAFGAGLAGAVPVTGDWNGSGTMKIGIYADGIWSLDVSGNDSWDPVTCAGLQCPQMDVTFTFGFSGAIPVAGDWTRDGTTKIGVYDPATAAWYLDLSGNGAWDGIPMDGFYSFGGGLPNAVPVVGDWDGTGTTRIGIYADGVWYLDLNGNGVWDGTPTDRQIYFGGGVVNAVPVIGDWGGTGAAKIGVSVNGTWYLDTNGNGGWDGVPVDGLYYFGGGMSGARPVTGKW